MVSTLVLTALLSSTPAVDRSDISWFHDDAPAAFAAAKKADKLVAVDVWATWCHTCLSMKNFVLTEKPLAAVASQHVFLALDYDKEKNAAFFEDFPIAAFPTFLVVDPKANSVVARWVGSGTAEEMARFFATADPKNTSPVVAAQRAIAAKDPKKAVAITEAALKKAKTEAEKTALLSPWVEAQAELDATRCATEGVKRLGDLTDNAPGIDVVAMVGYCAFDLKDEARKKAALEKIVARLTPLAKKPPKGLEVDDVSGMLGILADVYDALGEKKKADAITKRRIAILEKAAAEAPSVAARATYDYHRVGAYLRFGAHDEALKMLHASEKAQPDDFNHPWRLALVYLDRGDTKRGLAAIDRALERGYGARRLRLHATKIDLLLAAKDAKGARAQVAQARAEIAKMNPAQVRSSWVKMLDQRAEKIAALPDRG